MSEKTILFFHTSVRQAWIKELDGAYRFARAKGWRVQVIEPTKRPPAIQTLLDFWKPLGCIVDSRIAAEAPKEMVASGYADLIAKIPAGADWILADAIGAEAIHQEAWNFVQGPLRDSLSNPEGAASGDIAETVATRAVFGRAVPISSIKSYTGHTLGACGALEAALLVRSLASGWYPPTLNLRKVDPACAELDYVVGEGRALDIEYAMSNNFAFGGVNTSLIFRRA